MAKRWITYRWTASGIIYRVTGASERTLRIEASRRGERVSVDFATMVADLFTSGYRARESVGVSGRAQPMVDAALLRAEVASYARVFGATEDVARAAALGGRS